MTTNELENKLTNELKTYLKQQGYVDSGKLVASIKFTVKDSPSTGLEIDLDANDYIKYLDKGQLLDKFFAQSKIIDLVITYGSDKINDILESSL